MSMRQLLAIAFTIATLNLAWPDPSYSQPRFFDGKTITPETGFFSRGIHNVFTDWFFFLDFV